MYFYWYCSEKKHSGTCHLKLVELMDNVCHMMTAGPKPSGVEVSYNFDKINKRTVGVYRSFSKLYGNLQSEHTLLFISLLKDFLGILDLSDSNGCTQLRSVCRPLSIANETDNFMFS